MEELFDSLKNWGCDVDGALARFIGDRELYRSCLHTAAGFPVRPFLYSIP